MDYVMSLWYTVNSEYIQSVIQWYVIIRHTSYWRIHYMTSYWLNSTWSLWPFPVLGVMSVMSHTAPYSAARSGLGTEVRLGRSHAAWGGGSDIERRCGECISSYPATDWSRDWIMGAWAGCGLTQAITIIINIMAWSHWMMGIYKSPWSPWLHSPTVSFLALKTLYMRVNLTILWDNSVCNPVVSAPCYILALFIRMRHPPPKGCSNIHI